MIGKQKQDDNDYRDNVKWIKETHKYIDEYTLTYNDDKRTYDIVYLLPIHNIDYDNARKWFVNVKTLKSNIW